MKCFNLNRWVLRGISLHPSVGLVANISQISLQSRGQDWRQDLWTRWCRVFVHLQMDCWHSQPGIAPAPATPAWRPFIEVVLLPRCSSHFSALLRAGPTLKWCWSGFPWAIVGCFCLSSTVCLSAIQHQRLSVDIDYNTLLYRESEVSRDSLSGFNRCKLSLFFKSNCQN